MSSFGHAKIKLVKFKGMDKKMFNLYINECKFRFNKRGIDMFKILHR